MRASVCLAGLLSALVVARIHADTPLPVLYTLHCSGCHGEDGRGVPERGIPDLINAGSYVTVAIGRRYLIEVPGVSQSVLSNSQAADMLNYILARFSVDQLPKPFSPYTVDEVARFRSNKASDAPTRREAILAQLRRSELLRVSYAAPNVGISEASQRKK